MGVIGAVFIMSGLFELSLRAGLIGFGIILVAEVLFSLLKGRPYIWEASDKGPDSNLCYRSFPPDHPATEPITKR